MARKKDGSSVLILISSGGPRVFRSRECSRNCGWTGSPKVSLPIVQKDSDRPVGPRCRNDDIEKAIAVYIARCDPQSTSRRCDTQDLSRSVAKLEGDPIACIPGAALSDLHGGEVRPIVTIEIGDGKL
jgi:hypothetical protein